MDHKQFLLDEYKRERQEPAYFSLPDGESVLMPCVYHGDKDAFVDDWLSFQNEERQKYDTHNAANPDNPIEIPEPLKYGDLYILPPLKGVLGNWTEQKIIDTVLHTAMRKYKAAIKLTAQVAKIYPTDDFITSLDEDAVSRLKKLHDDYKKEKLEQNKEKLKQNLARTFKFTAKQTANILAGATGAQPAGATGALPAAAYYLLDKKVRFAKSKTKSFIDDTTLPYIRRGALKALIPLSVVAGGKYLGNILSSTDKKIPTKTTAPTRVKSVDKHYKITDNESFKQLYKDAFPLLIQSMLPTEILVCKPYSDNGKTINTLGLGSFWYPKNGDPKSSEWIKTSQYVKNQTKKGKKISITGTQAVALADGWFCHREGGRIYKTMMQKLKGAELTINEFAAIASCIYNDETKGKDFCDFVRENYKDPLKCAAQLASLKPKNPRFDDGIKKRHTHEALLYLNVNNYKDKIPYFQVKTSINSRNQEYYVTSVTQLNPNDCDKLVADLAAGSTNEARILADKISNYYCKDGKSLMEINNEHLLAEYIPFEDKTLNLQEYDKHKQAGEMYKKALASYQEGNYEEALSGFQKMIAQGFNGADIHNDMAVTYYRMGRYKDCIAECKEVLKTGEKEEYAKANYNAGLAYEEMRQYPNAHKNFKIASNLEPNNKTYQKAVARSGNQMGRILALARTRTK